MSEFNSRVTVRTAFVVIKESDLEEDVILLDPKVAELLDKDCPNIIYFVVRRFPDSGLLWRAISFERTNSLRYSSQFKFSVTKFPLCKITGEGHTYAAQCLHALKDDYHMFSDSQEYSFLKGAMLSPPFKRIDGTQYNIVPDNDLIPKHKVVDLIEQLKSNEKTIRDLNQELGRRRLRENGEVWFWEEDGNNDLDSLTCEVVIPAHVLKKLIKGK